MKKLITLLSFLTFFTLTVVGKEDNLPAYNSNQLFVQDFADVFSDEQESILNNKLQQFERKTTNEIVVVTVSDLGEYEASEYATSLHHKWTVGKKGVDNGLLILIAPNNRKWFISTGYGLEPYLPDMTVTQIGKANFPPNFKEKKYYEGVNLAVDEIIGQLSNVNSEIIQQYNAEQIKKDKESSANIHYGFNIFMILLCISVFGYIIYIYSEKQRKILLEKQRVLDLKALQEKNERETIQLMKDKINDRFNYISLIVSKINIYKIQDDNNTLVKNLLANSINFTYTIDDVNNINEMYELSKIKSKVDSLFAQLNKNLHDIQQLDNTRSTLQNKYKYDSSLISDINRTKSRYRKLQADISKYIPETYLIGIDELYNQLNNEYPIISEYIKTETIDDNFNKIINVMEKKITLLYEQISLKIRTVDSKCKEIETAHHSIKNISIKNLQTASDKCLSMVNKHNLYKMDYARLVERLDYLSNIDDIIILASQLEDIKFGFSNIERQIHENIEEERRRVQAAKYAEERRLRQIQEEAEAAERRRRDSYTSSYSTYSSPSSDYNSSSSWDSSSSFGGGDSGGGGGGGDW